MTLKRLEFEIDSLELGPALNDITLYYLSENLRSKGFCIPVSYWSFLHLVGGISSRGMWLWNDQEISKDAELRCCQADFSVLHIGECDQGRYVYFCDSDSYGIILSEGGIHNFSDFSDMLNHVISSIFANC